MVRVDGLNHAFFDYVSFQSSLIRMSIGYGSSGAVYDTDFIFNPFEGWIDEVYVWGRSLNETDVIQSFTLSIQLTSSAALRQAKDADDQVNQDIELTVNILIIGTLLFIACVWHQQRTRVRRYNDLHMN